MAVPDFQTLMLPVLKLTAPAPTKAKDILPAIVERFDLSEDDVQELLPSGRMPRLMNRLHWSNIHLSRSGLIEQVKRGVYQITPEGERVLAASPQRIDMKFLMGFDSYREWRSRSTKKTLDGSEASPPEADLGDQDQTPDEQMDQAFQQHESSLADDVLARVINVSPKQFEDLIVNLLLAMGFGRGMPDAGRAIGRSGDGGIDGVIDEDALGLDAVYVQAKRYAPGNTVGRPAIQQFVGSLTGESASKGVFVTTSDFSAEARKYADRVQQRVILINGQRLARLMIAYEIGVRARQTYVLRSIDEDYFIED